MTEHPTTLIRPRLETDLHTLAEVLLEVHERDGYPVEGVADPMAWLASDHLIQAWTAEVDGKPVGQVALSYPAPGDDAVELWIAESGHTSDSVAVLGRLFLGANARGHHLGRRLTTTAVEHSQEIGRRAVLDVMAKDAAAIRTYESLGWHRLGPISHRFADAQVEAAFAYVSPNVDLPNV